jgi:hypothetical protein
MADDGQSQNNGYMGGFSFGAQGGGTPVPPPPVQPVQPMQPVYQAPAYQAPQPGYQAPAYQAPMPPPPPMAGMGDPYGGAAADPNAGGQPFDPNYVFGAKMATFTTTIKLPAHQLSFDENRFLNLLAGSISLTKDEKKKIIDSIPKLRQEQVDELIRIFDEERAKFIELSPKHGAQLKKLEDEHAADWKDLEMAYKAASQGQEDQNKAEEIRKQLGL